MSSTPTNPASDDEHRKSMQTLQKEMREKLRAATERRGLIIVHTGNGKGKSTAAFGMVARMLAHGKRCAVVQFIKNGNDAVEKVLRGPLLRWDAIGAGFTWDTQDRAKDIATCEEGWSLARKAMEDETIDLVLLDELNVVISCGYLDVNVIIEALQRKRSDQHVVVTGRGAPTPLIELADLVTEMREIKHPFGAGVKAQLGIEF